MPDRAILREHFAEMLRVVEDAAGTYERVAAAAGDEGRREELKRIALDTGRHVELTERLLEIVNE